MPTTYDIFISYSHSDELFAAALEKALLNYTLSSPFSFKKKHLEIFRDKTEAKGNLLSQEIVSALNASKKLIVICSENSFKSKWVSTEILSFTTTHTKNDIIPVLIGESPESSFPEALLNIFGEEPWAPDFRAVKTSLKIKNDKQNWYHLLAAIYNLDRAVIEKREIRKRINKGIIILLVSILILTSGFFYNQQRSLANVENLKKKSLEFVTKAENATDVEEALNYSVLAVEAFETPESKDKLYKALDDLFLKIRKRYSKSVNDSNNNAHFSTRNGALVTIDKLHTKLFIASPLGSSVLYDFLTGEQQVFSGERYNAYTQVEFNQNGDLLATVDSHEKINIWSLKEKEIHLVSMVDSLPGKYGVEQLMFSGDNNLLLVKQMEGITFIKVKDGKIFKSINKRNFSSTSFQSDAKLEKFVDPGDIMASATVWSFITGDEIWESKSEKDRYTYIGFNNKDNEVILKKKVDLTPMFDDTSIIMRDSFLIIKFDKNDKVLSTRLEDSRELTYNYMIENFDIGFLNDVIATRLTYLYPGRFTDYFNKIAINKIANTVIIYRDDVAGYFFSLDSLKLKDSIALKDFSIGSTKFSISNDIAILAGYCKDSLCSNILVWSLREKKYISGFFYDGLDTWISNNGMQLVTKANDAVNIWNINNRKPVIIKSIDLFTSDITKLDADEKIFYDTTTVQQEIKIAKRWLAH